MSKIITDKEFEIADDVICRLCASRAITGMTGKDYVTFLHAVQKYKIDKGVLPKQESEPKNKAIIRKLH